MAALFLVFYTIVGLEGCGNIRDTNTDWKFVHRRFFCLDGEKRWCGFIVWFRQNDIFYILLLALGLLEVSVVRND